MSWLKGLIKFLHNKHLMGLQIVKNIVLTSFRRKPESTDIKA